MCNSVLTNGYQCNKHSNQDRDISPIPDSLLTSHFSQFLPLFRNYYSDCYSSKLLSPIPQFLNLFFNLLLYLAFFAKYIQF